MAPNIDHIRVLITGPFMVLIIDPIIGHKWAKYIIKINMGHKWVPFIGPNRAHLWTITLILLYGPDYRTFYGTFYGTDYGP